MARNRAFLFYPTDFLMGTMSLSHEDKGKYITILCFMHQKSKVKEDDIMTLVGTLSLQLKEKFIIDSNGYWHNIRLESETSKRERYIQSRRLNGIMGGRPLKRKSAEKQSDKGNGLLHNAMPVTQTPLHLVFNKWVEYRKSIRKPLKAQSVEGAFNRLKLLSEDDPARAESIVNYSIDNGYQGLFPLKENNYKPIKTTTEQWLA
jgi:uncharacterized protein YdaU (DUF1376 family)